MVSKILRFLFFLPPFFSGFFFLCCFFFFLNCFFGCFFFVFFFFTFLFSFFFFLLFRGLTVVDWRWGGMGADSAGVGVFMYVSVTLPPLCLFLFAISLSTAPPELIKSVPISFNFFVAMGVICLKKPFTIGRSLRPSAAMTFPPRRLGRGRGRVRIMLIFYRMWRVTRTEPESDKNWSSVVFSWMAISLTFLSFKGRYRESLPKEMVIRPLSVLGFTGTYRSSDAIEPNISNSSRFTPTISLSQSISTRHDILPPMHCSDTKLQNIEIGQWHQFGVDI